MDTAVLERNSVVYGEAWTKSVKTEKKKSFEEAVAECNGISVDAFFDELNARIVKWTDNTNGIDGLNSYHDASVYDEVLEPDDDLRRAISADEFKNRCLNVIDKIFHK